MGRLSWVRRWTTRRGVSSGAVIPVASAVLATSLLVAVPTSAHAVPDPSSSGPDYTVKSVPYYVSDTAFSVPEGSSNTASFNVEVQAELYYPMNLDNPSQNPPFGSLPLILILPGNHPSCYEPGQPESDTTSVWPCPAGYMSIPSYLGFNYLASNLASDGFIVASISTNGIEANEDTDTNDGGLLARAELAEYYLEQFADWNVDNTGPFGSTFVGHVDLNDVGVIGHSIGGGAAAELVEYNQSPLAYTYSPLGSHYGIEAVQMLSPFVNSLSSGAPEPGGETEQALPSLANVAVNVMEGYCDGDNVDDPGVAYLDQDIALDGTGPHSIVWVMGANHDYWDTVQIPAQYQAQDQYPVGLPAVNDDWSKLGSAYANDPQCGTSASTRLNPMNQQTVASDYSRAFFRWTLLSSIPGNAEFQEYFDGETTPPPSVNGAQILVDWLPPATPGDRFDVNLFDSPTSLVTDALGEPVVGASDISPCGPDETGYCTTGSPAPPQEPDTVGGGLEQVHAQWGGLYPNAFIDNELGSARDLSGGAILLRVGVDFGVTQPVPDFNVVVQDDLGNFASVPVNMSTQPLFLPPGGPPDGPAQVLPRETLQTIRIPLSEFGGTSSRTSICPSCVGAVRVDRIKAIDLVFNTPASAAAVTVADLMVTDSTASLAKQVVHIPNNGNPNPFYQLWLGEATPTPVTYRLQVPTVESGAAVDQVKTTGPFTASLVTEPGSGSSGDDSCSADCAADVTFDAPAGATPGTFTGSVTYTYTDGSTDTSDLVGHLTPTIPPGCTVSSGEATLSKALSDTPLKGTTTLKVSGALSSCISKGLTTKFPLTAGKFKVSATLDKGATCSSLANPSFSKSKVTITWQGENPKTGKLVEVGTDTSTVGGMLEQTNPVLGFDIQTTPDTSATGLFPGTTALFGLNLDEDTPTFTAACGSPGGVKSLAYDTAGGSDLIVR
jgi:hypothetical protein